MHLLELPEELIHSIISYLPQKNLLGVNLVNRYCYEVATPLIWREVELVDCRSTRRRPRRHDENGRTVEDDAEGSEENTLDDEHDDTPLIAKLLIILANKRIATSIHVLTHRCHLPPPPIFEFLPRFPFSSQTLSTDPRTIKLAQLAVREMTQVHTLRIILGHPTLTDALLRCFFDVRRSSVPEIVPVRRLWLEYCRISAGLNPDLNHHPYGLPLKLRFDGLQSIRFRRLPMHCGVPFDQYLPSDHVVFSRDGTHRQLPDGAGSSYITDISHTIAESGPGEDHVLRLQQAQQMLINPPGAGVSEALSGQSLEGFYAKVHLMDDLIFEALGRDFAIPKLVQAASLPHKERALLAYRGNWLDPEDLKTCKASPAWKRMQRERIPSAQATILMLQSCSATITSVNLDWLLTVERPFNHPAVAVNRALFYRDFFRLRFPHLRALQFRNAIAADTLLPQGLYLFDRWRISLSGMHPLPDSGGIIEELDDHIGLLFLEAHSRLQCLAWPLQQFFSSSVDPTTKARVDAVIANLARTLTDLRVDAMYDYHGDSASIEQDRRGQADIISCRRFVAEFASQMTQISSIKIEGGIPRDVRREILRALHASPVQKVVLIGSSHPLGNTWGENGEDIEDPRIVDDLNDIMGLEGEDTSLFRKYTTMELPKPSHSNTAAYLTPVYGWSNQPPLLYTLASHHSSTVTELKFCGYRGAPILLAPTPSTPDFFSALRFFHNLRALTSSFWLHTLFEDHANNDDDVLAYWRNMRDPNSTALVCVPSGADDDGEALSGWARELEMKFKPEALARRVLGFLAPLLSEEAKGREGGVLVRASFSLGAEVGGIFDLDLRIGKKGGRTFSGAGAGAGAGEDVLLGFVGPRAEVESERRIGKEMSRRWFW